MPHDDTTPKTITLSRRETVLGAFAVGSAATLTFGAPDVSAKAPMARSQASYWYRFPVGKFQATVI